VRGRVPRFLRFLGLGIGLLLLAYVGRFLFLFPWSPQALIFRDELEPADLIVVLEGEYEFRLQYAFFLAEDGYANRIYSPGYDRNEKKEELIKRLLEQSTAPIQMFFDTDASSTYEEALRVREFTEEHDIRSILLVTSNYHSLRSHWIFEKVLSGVKVISAPLPPEDNWFDPDEVEWGSFAHEIYRYEQLKVAAYYFAYGWRFYGW